MENKFIVEISIYRNPILSVNVYGVLCEFNIDYYSDKLFDDFRVVKPAIFYKLSVIRKAEFLAGRIAALCALKNIGIENFPIEIRKNRVPLWPQGIVGSISHTCNRAVSVVSLTSEIKNIGVDIENIMSIENASKVCSYIASRKEYELLMSTNFSFELCSTILFSAKETLFKAIYPVANIFFDFVDVELCSVSSGENLLFLQLNRDINTFYESGMIFVIKFDVLENYVITFTQIS
ncbi:4'-phosphopantetheinyl transferase EntD [Advenella incenata]|uniref:Enterobactin synthase component D n=1 Tax=Advenella incenata TaxID=267800 RepID=A0A4Q7VRT7_9BURK|nr:4'-phosphopantetheinyl transferase superfamily protein [Advenella incenata]RZT99024.1 4'-phosphopantetheinyl transferase EntD [Advenella incenata]